MDIKERVARLERQNRNLKKGIILGVVFIGGFFGLGQMSPAPSVIKAKEFQVFGDNGQVVALMGADPKGNGRVETNNAEGNSVAWMGAWRNGDGTVRTRKAKGVWESL